MRVAYYIINVLEVKTGLPLKAWDMPGVGAAVEVVAGCNFALGCEAVTRQTGFR